MSFRRGATVGQDVPGGLHNDQSFKVSGSGNTVNFAPDNSIHDNRTYRNIGAEIREAKFYDVRGDQHHHSLNVSGRGNTGTFAPNHSKQDNGTHNLGYRNSDFIAYHAAMYNHGGFPQIDAVPGVPEGYQESSAWQQQWSTAPPSLQRQTIDGLTSSHIPHRWANDLNDARVPHRAQTTQFQTYPRPPPPQSPPIGPHGQPRTPLHPSSFNPPPPSQPSGWGYIPTPGYQARHPPSDSHNRSYSQPFPNAVDELPEQSQIQSDEPEFISDKSEFTLEPDDAGFPASSALYNLGERFQRQVQVSGDVSNSPAPRPHSAPAPRPKPYIPTANKPTSALSSPRYQGTKVPTQVRCVSTSPPISSQHGPPPVPNLVTKPRPARGSAIPASATTWPLEHTQGPPPTMRTTHNQHHRPSSSSSSSSSTSSCDDEGPTLSTPISDTDYPQPTMPTPSVPIFGPSPIVPAPDVAPQFPSPPNTWMPPSLHESPTASPPPVLYLQAPVPTHAVSSPPVFPGTADNVFSQLSPLTNGISPDTSGHSEPPQKKTGIFSKISLARK